MVLKNNIVDKGRVLSSYFTDIRSKSLMSIDEEKLYFKAMESLSPSSDEYRLLFNKIIESNLRFVVSVAKQYSSMGVPVEDLINEGNLGLIEAAKRYTLKNEVRFISYAIWWVRLKVRSAISENSRTVRIPINRIALIAKVMSFIDTFEQGNNRTPTVEEVMVNSRLQFSYSDIREALEYYQSYMVGDNTISSNFEGVETSDSMETDFKVINSESSSRLSDSISSLNKKERDVITLKFGLQDHTVRSVKSIQQSLGISRNEYLYLLNSAMNKLKTKLS